MREISGETESETKGVSKRERDGDRQREGGSAKDVQIQAEHLSFCYKDYKLQIHLAHDALLLLLVPLSFPHPLPLATSLATPCPFLLCLGPLLFSSSLLSVVAFGASLSRFPFLLLFLLFLLVHCPAHAVVT